MSDAAFRIQATQQLYFQQLIFIQYYRLFLFSRILWLRKIALENAQNRAEDTESYKDPTGHRSWNKWAANMKEDNQGAIADKQIATIRSSLLEDARTEMKEAEKKALADGGLRQPLNKKQWAAWEKSTNRLIDKFLDMDPVEKGYEADDLYDFKKSKVQSQIHINQNPPRLNPKEGNLTGIKTLIANEVVPSDGEILVLPGASGAANLAPYVRRNQFYPFEGMLITPQEYANKKQTSIPVYKVDFAKIDELRARPKDTRNYLENQKTYDFEELPKSERYKLPGDPHNSEIFGQPGFVRPR